MFKRIKEEERYRTKEYSRLRWSLRSISAAMTKTS